MDGAKIRSSSNKYYVKLFHKSAISEGDAIRDDKAIAIKYQTVQNNK